MLFRTLQFGLRSISHVPAARFSLRAVSHLPKASYTRMSSASVECDLVNVLEQEMEYEKENQEPGTPEFLKEFRNLKTFKIDDTPGNNEVVLSHDTGFERITVTFSTDDINNCEESENNEEVMMSVSTVITIQKKDPALGALTFQTIVENGAFHISHVTHSPDPHLAVADDAETDYKRRGLYLGPIFDDLDETLSTAFHDYLEAKGIDSKLAQFIPNYVEFKEQLEYQRWLEKVRNFVQ